MKRYTYHPSTVCAQEISFDFDGKRVSNIEFVGGCNGNLKAIAKLLEGQTAEEIIKKLEGNTCGRRPTSCTDQLTRALRAALAEN
ncbi:MAG: TIGR03905 family TSCPD domain-containing protein [Clostridia bacterium]|nr:TIGR03905 family TSCPD domain-containing protein [Clostridia bacterium]